MKVKTITYAMLRQTKQFENDRAECSVELVEGEDVARAIALAKSTCERALAAKRARSTDFVVPPDGYIPHGDRW